MSKALETNDRYRKLSREGAALKQYRDTDVLLSSSIRAVHFSDLLRSMVTLSLLLLPPINTQGLQVLFLFVFVYLNNND